MVMTGRGTFPPGAASPGLTCQEPALQGEGRPEGPAPCHHPLEGTLEAVTVWGQERVDL